MTLSAHYIQLYELENILEIDCATGEDYAQNLTSIDFCTVPFEFNLKQYAVKRILLDEKNPVGTVIRTSGRGAPTLPLWFGKLDQPSYGLYKAMTSL